jgi:uncharacterized membrane protein YgdD (TMEM256/DUF423 family)
MTLISYQAATLISNSAFAASCVGLSFIFGRSFFAVRKEYPSTWYDREEAKSAIALFLIFFAGLIGRLYVVVLLMLRSHGHDTSWLEQSLPAPLFSGAIFVIAAACLTRVWTRNNMEWFVILAGSVIFCGLMLAIHGPNQATF